MTKMIPFGLLAGILITAIACSAEPDGNEAPEGAVTWTIDNLASIDSHMVEVFGDPEVIATDLGNAVYFDGVEDRLLIDHNPVGEATTFTVEVVFRPDACYPDNDAPRFVHIQDPDDERAKRLMIELRLNDQNQCYLDAFLKTDTSNLTLIDENLVHPTEAWIHAAVTYENGILTTYMNGTKELEGEVGFETRPINPTGKVSLGGRMNHVAFFRGAIRCLRVTPYVLSPDQFMQIETGQ